jgi:very-short-patch-repair endonuclease
MNIPFERSFASHEKSQFWSKKNTEKPQNVFKSSGKKFWFDCPHCNHYFDSSLYHVVGGCWCPFCSGNKLCNETECTTCFEKSFASHEKSKYWSKKNTENPRNVFKSSDKKFWFDCSSCNHSFDNALSSIYNNHWCPFCNNKRLCNETVCIFCNEKSFASHEKSQFWSKKNTENHRNVFKSSNKKFWFDCSNCNHSFVIALNNIVGGRWCPYCSNPPKQLCNETECSICFEKSFASHEKSKYWSKKNSKNPKNVFKSSGNKCWFDCMDCNHSFDAILYTVVGGCWCPYCSNPPKQLCNETECSICFEKSFASHEKSKYWSCKNTENPRNIFKSSDKKFWFDCMECNHSFDSSLGNVVNNRWCPFCSGNKLCNEKECIFCYNNSFASHEKSKYWSKKNTEKPQNVFKSSHVKFWFECHKFNHEPFESALNNIVKGQWCPFCKNKTEAKLYEKLLSIYPSLQRQFKQEWCKNIQYLPFDFCIPEYKIIIELDGPQHFQQVSNWCSPEEQFENDKFKEECANNNGYSVIRLLQEDVMNDTYDWVKELCDAIEQIKSSNEITNMYLYKNNEYENF